MLCFCATNPRLKSTNPPPTGGGQGPVGQEKLLPIHGHRKAIYGLASYDPTKKPPSWRFDDVNYILESVFIQLLFAQLNAS